MISSLRVGTEMVSMDVSAAVELDLYDVECSATIQVCAESGLKASKNFYVGLFSN